MQLAGLIPAALRDRGLSRARDLAHKSFVDSDSLDLTAPAALRPFVVAAVAAGTEIGGAGRPVLAVTATSREADDLADALGCLLSPDRVAVTVTATLPAAPGQRALNRASEFGLVSTGMSADDATPQSPDCVGTCTRDT